MSITAQMRTIQVKDFRLYPQNQDLVIQFFTSIGQFVIPWAGSSLFTSSDRVIFRSEAYGINAILDAAFINSNGGGPWTDNTTLSTYLTQDFRSAFKTQAEDVVIVPAPGTLLFSIPAGGAIYPVGWYMQIAGTNPTDERLFTVWDPVTTVRYFTIQCSSVANDVTNFQVESFNGIKISGPANLHLIENLVNNARVTYNLWVSGWYIPPPS